MESFEIKGEKGFINIEIDEVFGFPNKTSFLGGFECTLNIEIAVSKYRVQSNFYSSTGEIFMFYQKLKKCHTEVNGLSEFLSREENLKLLVEYKNNGHVKVNGEFQENLSVANSLIFDINSDQTFIRQTLIQLELIIQKYGNMQGLLA